MNPYNAVVKVLLLDLDQKVIQNEAKIHAKSITKLTKHPSEKQLENLMKKQQTLTPKGRPSRSRKVPQTSRFRDPLPGGLQGSILNNFSPILRGFGCILGGCFS
jgi:hypothetical protein